MASSTAAGGFARTAAPSPTTAPTPALARAFALSLAVALCFSLAACKDRPAGCPLRCTGAGGASSWCCPEGLLCNDVVRCVTPAEALPCTYRPEGTPCQTAGGPGVCLDGACVSPPRCGNAAIDADAGEQCDGAELGSATCASLGFRGGGALACSDLCRFDTSQCRSVCGNGEREPDEACDASDLGGATCEARGYPGGTLACSSDCLLRDDSGCLGDCGDGLCQLSAGEDQRTCPEDCHTIAAGDGRTCSQAAGGLPVCWGDNTAGLLGDGTTTDSPVPVPVAGLGPVVDITTGSVSCAVTTDASALCWGPNVCNALGSGACESSPTPVPVVGPIGITGISASYLHTCASTADGSAWCWGEGLFGSFFCDCSPESWPLPAMIEGIDDVVAVSAGGISACAVSRDGEVWCWGDGIQLSSDTFGDSDVPVRVSGVPGAATVSIWSEHYCAVALDGSVWCWGANRGGQLGNGTTEFSTIPTRVHSLPQASAVACGAGHTCAVTLDGSAWCWGANHFGALGDGTTISSPVPVRVWGVQDAVSISVEYDYSCAMTYDGSAWCWGDNAKGQLGNGTRYTSSLVPVRVVGLP